MRRCGAPRSQAMMAPPDRGQWFVCSQSMPTNRAPERERNPQQVRCPGVAAAWLPATPSESRSDLSRTLPTVIAAPCSLGSGEFRRNFAAFLSSSSRCEPLFASQTLRQADVILWLYFVMTSCIHFTLLQLILLYTLRTRSWTRQVLDMNVQLCRQDRSRIWFDHVRRRRTRASAFGSRGW